MLGNIKDKAVEGKDATTDAAGSAGDKASEIAKSTQESAVAGKDNTGGVLQNAGQTIMNAAQSTGQTAMNYAKGGTENVKNTLGMGGNTTPEKIAQSTQETAVAGKDKTGGVLQSTGDTVTNAAQGATETVKDTLGIKK